MKIINKPSLMLTEEEKILLNKAATLMAAIEKDDTHGDLAESIIGYVPVGSFDELANLLYSIADSAENE